MGAPLVTGEKEEGREEEVSEPPVKGQTVVKIKPANPLATHALQAREKEKTHLTIVSTLLNSFVAYKD